MTEKGLTLAPSCLAQEGLADENGNINCVNCKDCELCDGCVACQNCEYLNASDVLYKRGV